MVTDVLPNGCVLEYHLSHQTYSRIHVYDAEHHSLYDFAFEPWQFAMAERALEMVRTVAQPRRPHAQLTRVSA